MTRTVNVDSLIAALSSEAERLRGEAGEGDKAKKMRADILSDISRCLVIASLPPSSPPALSPLSDSPPTHTPAHHPPAKNPVCASVAPQHTREKFSLTRQTQRPLFSSSMLIVPEIKEVIDTWNTNFTVSRISVTTNKVITTIGQCLAIPFFKGNWKEARKRLVRSEFLMKKKRGAKPDIFWFCDMDNFQSLMNGKYDNTKTTTDRDYTQAEL